MVGSKELNNKLKTTSEISLRTRQAAAAAPATPATEENNEELIETIRKIVREELEDYQKKVSVIIKSQLRNTNERLDKISQEVVEITKSIEFTKEELYDGLANVKNDIEKVQTDLRGIEGDLLDLTFVMEKLTKLEDRSRWNNVRIDGIPETPNESWENCEEEVRKIIRNKLDITDDIEIDRCHRMGKFQRNKSKPRTVVCTFLHFKDKHKVLLNAKKLKDTGIFIYEYVSKTTMQLRKSLWEKVLQHRQQNKIAHLNYRSIVVKDHIARKFIFCFC